MGDISWGDTGIGHPCEKERSCPLGFFTPVTPTGGGASGMVVGKGIASARARNEVRGTIMCASVFPLSHKNIEGVFVGTVVPLLCRNMS